MLPLITICALGFAFLSGLLPFAFNNKQTSHLVKLSSVIPLGISGLCALASGGITLSQNCDLVWRIPLSLPNFSSTFRLDALAGFFLALIGLILFTVAIFAYGYLRKYEKSQQSLTTLTFFTGIFSASMMLVVLAADVFSFMVAWELMSLASYFLVTYQHHQTANRRAGFLYLIMAHLSGLFILLSFSILVEFGGALTFSSLQHLALPAVLGTLVFIFALIGFGIKAGLIPFHTWLPQAHPAAPAHISALMSGVMLKIAVYGFVRIVFQMLGNNDWRWGLLVLVIGATSALFGILYATVQTDLKRLLAYSSIENIGIIFIGLGLAIIFFATGHQALGALSLIAALLHCFNHALFKSLLFFAAGAMMQHSHQNDLEKMGGLVHKMPQTAVFALIGCLSVSALPPFNGFVSEWLTLQAALQTSVLPNSILRMLVPAAAAILVLTGALAATCFVKLYGIAFLGQPRTREAKHARDPILSTKIAMAILAVLCLAGGVFPNWFLTKLSNITLALFGTLTSISTKQSSLAWSANYNAPLTLILIVALSLLIFNLLSSIRPKKSLRTAWVNSWDCGFGGINSRMQYTATAFAMPIRRVFKFVFLISEKITKTFNPKQPLQAASIEHKIETTDPLSKSLYEPWSKLITAVTRSLAKAQGGQMRIYLTYIFLTLILLLWVVLL